RGGVELIAIACNRVHDGDPGEGTLAGGGGGSDGLAGIRSALAIARALDAARCVDGVTVRELFLCGQRFHSGIRSAGDQTATHFHAAPETTGAAEATGTSG